jgi:hypothetical protein
MKVSMLFAVPIVAAILGFSGCGPHNEIADSITTNPNLLSVVGSNETGYRYTFKSGLVCNRPAYYTKYIKTGGAIAIRSLFDVKGDFESDWRRTAPSNPKVEELQSVFFDMCFEYGNGLIDKQTYDERSNRYDRIRQKMMEQGLTKDPESDIRFEARLAKAEFFKVQGKQKGEFTWKLEPTIVDQEKAIRVFLGLTVLHNEDTIPAISTTDKSCSEVPSCISYKLWNMEKDPVVIRGGPPSSGSEISWVTEIPKGVKVIRVYWEFYQLEADSGNKCSIIAPHPKGGMPLLGPVSASGEKAKGVCYYSTGKKLIKVTS